MKKKNVINVLHDSLGFSKQDYFEHLLLITPSSVYWKDLNGVYLGCNRAMLEFVGVDSVDKIIGKTDFDLPWKPSAKEFQQNDQVVIESGKLQHFEETGQLSDATVITGITNKMPLRDLSGKIIGVIGSSIDITQQKETEKALLKAKKEADTANEAKTEFLYNMRHDLRTPFCGILGISEVLEGQETDPKKREYLGYIVQAAKQLLDHLNEIFEFIQLETGQTTPVLEKQINFRPSIASVIDMLRPAAKDKQLDFRYEIDSEVPPFIIGDQMRTQRILINLLSNAIKFTKEGSVELKISVEKKERSIVVLKFVIKDTGIGIPEDKYDVIFEKFNRLTSSYSGVYEGKGLGLRLVKLFLDEVGGEVFVKSTEGQGATFTALIPYKISLFDRSQYELENK